MKIQARNAVRQKRNIALSLTKAIFVRLFRVFIKQRIQIVINEQLKHIKNMYI